MVDAQRRSAPSHTATTDLPFVRAFLEKKKGQKAAKRGLNTGPAALHPPHAGG